MGSDLLQVKGRLTKGNPKRCEFLSLFDHFSKVQQGLGRDTAYIQTYASQY
jgi:hypothetical protein